MCYMRSTTIYYPLTPFVLRCMRGPFERSRCIRMYPLKWICQHINISTSTGHQKLLVGGCNMLLTSYTCSTIRKLNVPKLGRFSNLTLVLILVVGISHGSNPPSNLISVLILNLVANISHGSNPPSNLILVLILVAGLSHVSNPLLKLILNLILNLI